MAKEHKTEIQKGSGNGPKGGLHSHMAPFEDMERWFESAFPMAWPRPSRWEWPRLSQMQAPFEGRMPKVDVIDREAEVLVRAELAGVDKKDIDISVSDNTVTIRGSTRQESKEEKGDYYRCEISEGSFARTVALPCDVDSDKAKAAFKDGLLELTLPKRASAKRHTVKVE